MVSSCHGPTKGVYWDGRRRKVVTGIAKSSAPQEPHEVTAGGRWPLCLWITWKLDRAASESFSILPVFIDSCNCPNETLHL